MSDVDTVIQDHLEEGETVELVDTCKLTPFLLRFCPFYPDVLIKKAAIVVTQHRLLIFTFKSLGKRVKRVEKFRLDEIEWVQAKRGLLTSKLVLTLKSGEKRKLENLLKSTAGRISDRISALRAA